VVSWYHIRLVSLDMLSLRSMLCFLRLYFVIVGDNM
jgi:hypothetical protein